MGCRFELLLAGAEPIRLRGAAAEAVAVIERLHRGLNRFDPGSAISRLNREAHRHRMVVDPELFVLLRRCRELHDLTRGAFDITVTPLLAVWDLRDGETRRPDDQTLRAALERVGMDRVTLIEETREVAFARPGMTIDLGAIGKGYAVEEAVELLREVGVPAGLVHAGTSSVAVIGSAPSGHGWPIEVANPADPARPLGIVRLAERALGVSGRTAGGRRHIVDPRTGEVVEGHLLAAVTHPSPTVADALSTALLVAGEELLERLPDHCPEAATLLVCEGRSGGARILTAGGWEMD